MSEDNGSMGTDLEILGNENPFVDVARNVFSAVNEYAIPINGTDFTARENIKKARAVKAISQITEFYGVYRNFAQYDCDFPENMDTPTPTMIARKALWDAFKPKETQVAVNAHSPRSRTRRESQTQLHDLMLDNIRRLDLALEELQNRYRNGHGTLHPEKPLGTAVGLDDFEKCILEVRTIVDRLFLEFISGIDLNPNVNFESIQDEYTKAFVSNGYKYIRETKEQSDRARNARRIDRVKNRWGTRFGEIKAKTHGKSKEVKPKQPGRRASRPPKPREF